MKKRSIDWDWRRWARHKNRTARHATHSNLTLIVMKTQGAWFSTVAIHVPGSQSCLEWSGTIRHRKVGKAKAEAETMGLRLLFDTFEAAKATIEIDLDLDLPARVKGGGICD